jgi:hypothetical protein
MSVGSLSDESKKPSDRQVRPAGSDLGDQRHICDCSTVTTISIDLGVDLAKYRGDIVVDVMRTHPMVMIGGTI